MAVDRGAKALIAVAVFVVWQAGTCAAIRGGAAVNGADVEFIRASCGTTSYPQLCFDTLSAHASTIQRNPVMLATTALSVSLDRARIASAAMSRMAIQVKMKPRERGAMKDCIETMADSVNQIRQSILEMGYLRRRDQNLAFHISNIQTWASAALTDERTCMEGISEVSMNPIVKNEMRNHVVNVAHRISNALALISALVSSPP